MSFFYFLPSNSCINCFKVFPSDLFSIELFIYSWNLRINSSCSKYVTGISTVELMRLSPLTHLYFKKERKKERTKKKSEHQIFLDKISYTRQNLAAFQQNVFATGL